MKAILALVFCGLFSLSATAEVNNNKLIVKLKPGENPIFLQMMGYENIEPIIEDMGLYLVEIPQTLRGQVNIKSVAKELRSSEIVQYAQEDHPIEWRSSTPNDANFIQQWDMLKDGNNWGIDALSAWTSFGPGGVDARGSEIVVAVVDGGMDIAHKDLAPNVWVNHGEIPNNGRDDDNNGYIDDVNGWNVFMNSGRVMPDMHGTHVAGTIGGVGNNGLFGVGVNWNVKIMAVQGASNQTSVVLKAYGYVLAQKKLWLATNGQKGANIVSTNSSFGVNMANCKSASFAAWNDVYNEMGKYGILSAAATANWGMDIDSQGDVPTGCDSPYLVTVTNSMKNGRMSPGSAWGKASIDLAAPGTNIFSTVPMNRWQPESGTSMSSPHVAGAIAYLHSAASKNLNDLYYQDPSQAALLLKQAMLQTVTPAPDFVGRTVSGGILDLYSSAAAVSKY